MTDYLLLVYVAFVVLYRKGRDLVKSASIRVAAAAGKRGGAREVKVRYLNFSKELLLLPIRHLLPHICETQPPASIG